MHFALKASNAKAAGAMGTIIYNNVPDGVLQGTLGGPGDYAPTVGITQVAGQALAASITGGTPATANLNVDLTETLTYVWVFNRSSALC